MLNVLAIANYRTLRDVVIQLKQLNVITGANGTGKSSLYRTLRLLADTAQGRVVPSLVREGGLTSTLWAGPESIAASVRRGEYPVEGIIRKQRVNLRLGFSGTEYGYLIDLGSPPPGDSAFSLDPEIKPELVWHGAVVRPASVIADRKFSLVRSRGSNGEWQVVSDHLPSSESMMSLVVDPRQSPELLFLRESTCCRL